jgi:hypothetical protein
MGKEKSSTCSCLRQYVNEFKDVFTAHGKVLFCQVRGESTFAQQRFQVTRQLSGNKHTASVVRQAVSNWKEFSPEVY